MAYVASPAAAADAPQAPRAQGRGAAGGRVPLSHTRPHQSTPTVWSLPAAVVPSKRVRRRRGRRNQQGGGFIPPLHAAGPGLAPQRLARFLPPHGGEVLAPRIREAAAAEIRPGGARVEDLGVPPL